MELNETTPDSATVVTQETPLRRPKKRINYALAATMLTTGLTSDQIAAKVGAKNGQTLRVGLLRKGVTRERAVAAQADLPVNCSLALRVASQAGELLREEYSNLLAKTAAKLNQIPVRANPKSLKALGEAAEPFVRMAKIVHDWGNQSKEGMAMVGLWQEPAPQEPQGQVTDIQAVVVEPEKPSNPS